MIGRGGLTLPLDLNTRQPAKLRREIRQFVYCRDGFYCVYCGEDLLHSLNSLRALTRDHVFPKSKGGKNTPENLVTCRKVCNLFKGNVPFRTAEEARPYVMEQRRERARMLHKLQSLHR